MNTPIIFIIWLAISTAHGNGCTLQSKTDVLYEVECDGGLDDLTNLIPQYFQTAEEIPEYDEYNERQYTYVNHVNDHKIYINIINVDLDSTWDENYEYMNGNVEKLTINDVTTVPNRIAEFTNIKEVINGNGNVLREIKLNLFLSLSQVKEIRFTHSFIESILSVHANRRTSDVNLIDLSYNRIETLPNSCFANFPILSYLDLSHNLIQNINILTFEGGQSLETIDISFNRIKEIGHSFVRFINVKTMFLNNNNLTKIIEPNFVTMNALEKLDVSFNMLSSIEENSFQNLRNIEELDLSNNYLTKITKGTLQNSTKIYKISFSNNPLHKIESNVFAGHNITEFAMDGLSLIGRIEKRSFVGINTDNFNLSHGRIDTLETEAFTDLRTRVLNLSHNVIGNISITSFIGIKFLETLDLSNNNLSSIDFKTTDLKQLLIFYVQHNHISKISKLTFDNFVSLKILDLSYNNLLLIEPDIFLNLNQLEFIDVSKNYLANALNEKSFQGLSMLKTLHLMFNKFTTIDNNTFQGLKSLEVLNCSHGELSSIGFRAFENTTALTTIDFSYNSLRNFNIFTTSIASVKELRLNDNAITNITEQMPSIEKLNLANNNIAILKADLFTSSKNLSVLDLSSNNAINFEDIFENITFLSELGLSYIGKPFNFDHIKVSISNLDLSLNNIENVSSIFIYKIKGITFLNLRSNKISIVDKTSFQNMPALTNLDLSFNLINFLQPGSFLQLNALKSLNLHDNSIQALQFGVLDGLNHLKTLNLSSNSIHQFEVNILRSSSSLETLALDDNVIENFKFNDFLATDIKIITIGGNPLSCHTIADFKKRKDVFTVTAEVLDYHTENIDGVKCTTNLAFNKSLTFSQDKKDYNASSSFLVLAKAIDGFRSSVDNFRQTFDKLSLSNNTNKKVEPPTQNVYLANITNNSDINLLFRNIASMERLLRNLTNISQAITKHDQKSDDRVIEENKSNTNLQEKINVSDAEKENIIKESHDNFDNLKHDSFIKSNAQVNNPDDYAELKAMMYFVAACLSICVILILSFVIFKLFQIKKQFQSDSYRYSSSQPISNIIELQEN